MMPADYALPRFASARNALGLNRRHLDPADRRRWALRSIQAALSVAPKMLSRCKYVGPVFPFKCATFSLSLRVLQRQLRPDRVGRSIKKKPLLSTGAFSISASRCVPAGRHYNDYAGGSRP